MATTNFQSIEAYLEALPEATRALLGQVRAAIHRAVPQATETISYQIPAFKTASGTVLFFAGWKKHYSIYPASERVVQRFETELQGLKVSRGTIQFPLTEPVPVELIAAIARERAEELDERAAAKAAAMPRPRKK